MSSRLRSVALLHRQLVKAWTSADRCGPLAVRQADGQARPTKDSVEVLLTLGALEEPTLCTVFDLDCDADDILVFPWLRSHGLAFVYEYSQVCFCTEAGCTSGRRVRMDLAQASATPAESSSVLRGPALLQMIREAGLEVPTLPRPSLWTPLIPGTSATVRHPRGRSGRGGLGFRRPRLACSWRACA